MDDSIRSTNRRISFNETVKCYLVVGMSADSWYSDHEYARFKKDTHTIQQCIVTKKMASSMFCTRGMEHLIDTRVNKKKRERRFLSCDTVFSVQEKQWDAEDAGEQKRDDTALTIGEAYAKETLNSRGDAHTQGLQDQYEARLLQSNDERAYTKLCSDQTLPSSNIISLDLNGTTSVGTHGSTVAAGPQFAARTA
jgi:hypothetical protein